MWGFMVTIYWTAITQHRHDNTIQCIRYIILYINTIETEATHRNADCLGQPLLTDLGEGHVRAPTLSVLWPDTELVSGRRTKIIT